MSLKIKGTIKEVLKVVKGKSEAGKKWMKRDFILTTDAEYNPDICFTVFGEEKIAKIFDKFDEGEEVEVSFNLSSNEHEGNYFHNVNAWKVTEA